jgi:nucleotide-binding universal stress UspA family protein
MRTAAMLATPTLEPTIPIIDRPSAVPHILLATDLDDASTRATEEAIRLAIRDNAVLQILAVAEHPNERQRLERGVRALRHQAREAGVVATSVIWSGDPAEAILEAAWTERPDVLIVGARRHRRLARLLGSVSLKVVREAPCEVRIVPGL